MVLVMDTFGLRLCMPLIVAMSMESLKIRDGVCATQTERPDVIYFYQIPILKVQSTEPTLPLLIFQQLSHGAVSQGMRLESLCPVHQIAIVGAGGSPDFGMALDCCFGVFPEGHLFRSECPSFALVESPVSPGNPGHIFVRVSAF